MKVQYMEHSKLYLTSALVTSRVLGIVRIELGQNFKEWNGESSVILFDATHFMKSWKSSLT